MAYCSPDRILTYLDTPSFYSSALHGLSVIAIPTHLFGAYCILFRTPPRMSSVKWSLLNLHFWTCFVDLGLSVLTIPFLIIPIYAGYPLGILRFTGMSTEVQTFFMVCTGALMLVSIVGIFENRYHVLNTPNHWWHRARLPWLVINCLTAFTFFLPVYWNFPDQVAAKAFVLEMLPCLPEEVKSAELLVVSTYNALLYRLAGTEIFFCLFQILFFYRRIRSVLHQYGCKLSEKTLGMQKKLMRALILQLVLPFLIIILPVFYCGNAAWALYHNQALNNISFITISSHGFLSTISMIFMHPPYRQVVFQWFGGEVQRRKSAPNSISGHRATSRVALNRSAWQ